MSAARPRPHERDAPRPGPPLRIVSGGQSGVDRAALDVAMELGLPCGGWCPRGRRAEDGPIDERYPLIETPSGRTTQRTQWNVRDSDATLIVAPPPLSGGTALTERWAARLGRPCLVLEPDAADAVNVGRAWLHAVRPSVLNVAGPRESGSPGIGGRAKLLLRRLLG